MLYYITQETAVNIIKVLALGSLAFILAFAFTPYLIKLLYKYKLWRKEVRQQAIDGAKLEYFQKFHTEGETHIPRFGGILIWAVPLVLTVLFYLLAKTGNPVLEKLNFLSRSQTWLPFFALIAASFVGLIDDVLQILGKGKYIAGGLSLKKRIFLVFIIGLIGALWFYYKLGWRTIHMPGAGDFEIGFWYIPLFMLVTLATYSGGIIDGLDGLAGGVFASIFAAFTAIALFQGQIDLAAFSSVILGVLLAFLWFNIPPAKFYMGESGILGLCIVLTVIAFLTNSVLVLPVIGFLLVAESGSVILQLFSKRFRHKKIFLASPIHHHFEAKGWPHYQITMRFWIIGAVMAIIGLAIRLLG